MTLRIETESGSVYYMDTETKTLKRTPGENAGALINDGEAYHYEGAPEPTIGKPLHAVWNNNGKLQVRSTTPVVSIEET